jgi:ribosome-binding protein aMBF1 (putative translation factor)
MPLAKDNNDMECELCGANDAEHFVSTRWGHRHVCECCHPIENWQTTQKEPSSSDQRDRSTRKWSPYATIPSWQLRTAFLGP